MKAHKKQHNKQLHPLSSSSLTNSVYNIIRWLLIIGIYITIAVDLLIFYTESFITTQPQQDSQSSARNLLQKTNNTILSVGPFTSLLISCGFLDHLPSTITTTTHNKTRTNTTSSSSSSSNHNVDDGSKDYVVQQLLKAGISYNEIQENIKELPSWEQIISMFGNEPVILGLSTCSTYQNQIPAIERMIGPAGMFSTGTNLVTQLLKQNCYIPERLQYYGNNLHNVTKEQLGMRWQVPWGKHTPAHFRRGHAAKLATNVKQSAMLPIVTVRNPWTWMHSMCTNPYATVWKHHPKPCPMLKWKNPTTNIEEWNEVSVKYGAGTVTYPSLQHLWNKWYNEYYHVLYPNTTTSQEENNEQYPLLIVRMEDIVFHTEKTIKAICTCAGGVSYPEREFKYVIRSAKANVQGHSSTVGLLEAWIKYSQVLPLHNKFTITDYSATLEAIDQNLMKIFQYPQPPTINKKQ